MMLSWAGLQSGKRKKVKEKVEGGNHLLMAIRKMQKEMRHGGVEEPQALQLAGPGFLFPSLFKKISVNFNKKNYDTFHPNL